MNNASMRSDAEYTLKRSGQILKSHAAICFCLVAFWLTFPQIDLWVSQQFFLSHHSSIPELSGFILDKSQVLWFLYGVDVLGKVILLCSILHFLGMLIKKHKQTFNAFVVMMCLITAPFLVVNMMFKDHWGRARPVQIEAFGGTQHFTPPWIMTNQCDHNCSFTSGHAAAGFVLSIGALVSRRKFWLPAGIVLGASFGLVRILNGAHFLSDVIFSYFLVMLTSAGVAFIISAIVLSFVHRAQVKHVIG